MAQADVGCVAGAPLRRLGWAATRFRPAPSTLTPC